MSTLQPISWADTRISTLLSRVYRLVTQELPAELADVDAAIRASVTELKAFLDGLNGLLRFTVVQLGDGAAASPQVSLEVDPVQPMFTASVRVTTQPASGVARVVRLVTTGRWSAAPLLEAVRRLRSLRENPSGALTEAPAKPAVGPPFDPVSGVGLAVYACEAALRGTDADFLHALCLLLEAGPAALGLSAIVADDVDAGGGSACDNHIGVETWIAVDDGKGGLKLDLELILQLPETDTPMRLRLQDDIGADVLAVLRAALRRLWLPTEKVEDLESAQWFLEIVRMIRALGNPNDAKSWSDFRAGPQALIDDLVGIVTVTGCDGEGLPVQFSYTGKSEDGAALAMEVKATAPVDSFGQSIATIGVQMTKQDYLDLRKALLNTARKPAPAP